MGGSASAKGKQYKARLFIGGDLIGTATRVYNSELPENRKAKGDEAKYFCFENIRFQNSGKYALLMQILDEDRVLCERRVPVVVRANEPQSFELRGNFDGEIASLGGFLPSFSIVFLDANGNQTIPTDSVTVKIEGEGVSVYCEGQSQPMFQFSDDDVSNCTATIMLCLSDSRCCFVCAGGPVLRGRSVAGDPNQGGAHRGRPTRPGGDRVHSHSPGA